MFMKWCSHHHDPFLSYLEDGHCVLALFSPMHQLLPRTQGWVLFPSAAPATTVGVQLVPAELDSDVLEKLSLHPLGAWALSVAQ